MPDKVDFNRLEENSRKVDAWRTTSALIVLTASARAEDKPCPRGAVAPVGWRMPASAVR